MLSAVKPYLQLMRFDKPIGTLLLLWPTLWALWIAAKGTPNPHVLAIFILGVIIMRAAGCVINDYADRNFDGHVTRTCTRPLVTGAINPKHALLLFFALGALAFLLVLMLGRNTILLSIPAIALAASYPFCKRFTHLPQLVLGVAFSWGIIMAFVAESHTITLAAWLLFLFNVIWTIAYDTQYAMVDRKDDLLAGIKSTAILFGAYDYIIVALMQIICLFLLFILGLVLHLAFIYYFTLIIAAFLFGYQQRLIYHREPKNCFRAFLNNNWVGAVIFIGLLLAL